MLGIRHLEQFLVPTKYSVNVSCCYWCQYFQALSTVNVTSGDAFKIQVEKYLLCACCLKVTRFP